MVHRNFAFLGPESVWAAEAAQCAADQGRFDDYYQKLFLEQRGENEGAFRKPQLQRFAAELGLDHGRFDACLEHDRHLERIEAEREAGARQGVRSTPTLFVNGRKIESVPSFEQLVEVIEAAARGQRARER